MSHSWRGESLAIFGASMGIRTERARDREIKKNERKSYSGKTKVFCSKSLQTIGDQIGLIELVNDEIKEGIWGIKHNPLCFNTHNREPCWHIRLYKISNVEEE